MSKQTLQNIDSENSLTGEAGGAYPTKTKSALSSTLKKYKVLLCLVGAVAAAIVVTLCVALIVVLVVVRKPQEVNQSAGEQQPSEGQFDPIIDEEMREKLHKHVCRHAVVH